MRALVKGLWEAETWSLRWNLFAGAFAILAVTIGVVARAVHAVIGALRRLG